MNNFEEVVNLATNRGFVFNASSIYGGLRSSYDYGPLGTLLKKNISDMWWGSTIKSNTNIYPKNNLHKFMQICVKFVFLFKIPFNLFFQTLHLIRHRSNFIIE